MPIEYVRTYEFVNEISLHKTYRGATKARDELASSDPVTVWYRVEHLGFLKWRVASYRKKAVAI